jgi:hypothetical protein
MLHFQRPSDDVGGPSGTIYRAPTQGESLAGDGFGELGLGDVAVVQEAADGEELGAEVGSAGFLSAQNEIDTRKK